MINVQVIDKIDRIDFSLFDADIKPFFCTDEVQAFNEVEEMQPSVILLNYDVLKDQTIDYIRLIINVSPDSKVVVIADELSEEYVLSCLIAGAKGFQELEQLDQYVNKLIKVVDKGEVWITRRMVAILLENIRNGNIVIR
ncbi:MAG: DNA-binding response regulator [Methylococcaceae bacterium]